jgi:Fe-S-cluster containining protein
LPGRNDPCPCGSSKKYKKCCGAPPSPAPAWVREKGDHTALHRAIAYRGKIGQMRADFCRRYTAYKQTLFEDMEKYLSGQITARAEKLTCRKGCHYCCFEYIGGTLHECEAIVYYLYRNRVAFDSFLQAYAVWREKVSTRESLFDNIKDMYIRGAAEGFSEKNLQDFRDASLLYSRQRIPCPFLVDGLCSIYEVRPRVCASIAATTAAEWCSPLSENEPTVLICRSDPQELEPPFFREPMALGMTSIPVSVYEILTGGYVWLSEIPGLEGLDKEAMSDPEVRLILKRCA